MAARLLQEKSFLFLVSLQEPISPLDPSRSHRSRPWELAGAEPPEKIKVRWEEAHTGPGPSPEAGPTPCSARGKHSHLFFLNR